MMAPEARQKVDLARAACAVAWSERERAHAEMLTALRRYDELEQECRRLAQIYHETRQAALTQ